MGRSVLLSSSTLVVCALSLWLCALCARPSAALTVQVAAKQEECFFDEIKRGEKVLGSFQVVKGGYLDIDVRVWREPACLHTPPPVRSSTPLMRCCTAVLSWSGVGSGWNNRVRAEPAD